MEQLFAALSSRSMSLQPVIANPKDFSQAGSWARTNIAGVVHGFKDTDGGQSADEIQENTANGLHFVQQTPISTFQIGLNAVAEIDFQYVDCPWIWVQVGNRYCFYNVQTGQVGTSSTSCSGRIQRMSGGWFKTFTSSFAPPGQDVAIGFGNGDNITSYVGTSRKIRAYYARATQTGFAQPTIEYPSDLSRVSAWARTGVSVAHGEVDSDGNLEGDLITEDGSNGAHFLTQNLGLVASGLPLRLRARFRVGTSGSRGILFNPGGGVVYVNPSTGAVTSQTGLSSVTTSSIGNGWWFLDMVVAAAAGSTLAIGLSNAPGSATYLGDGTSNGRIHLIEVTQDRIAQWNDPISGKYVNQSATANQPRQLSDGRAGRDVIDFDGTDDYLQAAAAADWKFLHDGTGMTVLAVVSPEDNGTDGGLITTGGAVAAHRGLFTQYDGANQRFDMNISDGAANIFASAISTPTLSVPRGQWYVVAFTYKEGSSPEAAIWVNSVKVASADTTAPPSSGNPTLPLTLGLRSNLAVPFDGKIAELRTYTRELNATEIGLEMAKLGQKWQIAQGGEGLAACAALWLDEKKGVTVVGPTVAAPDDFASGSWTKVGSTVLSNVEVSPYTGQMTVDKIVASATGPTGHAVTQSISASTSVGIPVTHTIGIKAAGYNYALLSIIGGVQGDVGVDLVSGMITGTSGGAIGTARKLDNGWVEVDITFATTSGITLSVNVMNGPNIATDYWFIGDGSSGIYVANSRATQPRVSAVANQGTAGAVLNWTSATVNQQPSYANGKIDFDGVDDRLVSTGRLSDFILNSAYELYMVVEVDTYSSDAVPYANDCVICDAGGYLAIAIKDNAGTKELHGFNYDGSSDDAVSVSVSPTTPHLLHVRHEGGNIYSRVDTGTEVSAASGNTQNLAFGDLRIGVTYDLTTNFLDGRVREIIGFKRNLIAAERAALRAWLSDKYGQSW